MEQAKLPWLYDTQDIQRSNFGNTRLLFNASLGLHVRFPTYPYTNMNISTCFPTLYCSNRHRPRVCLRTSALSCREDLYPALGVSHERPGRRRVCCHSITARCYIVPVQNATDVCVKLRHPPLNNLPAGLLFYRIQLYTTFTQTCPQNIRKFVLSIFGGNA